MDDEAIPENGTQDKPELALDLNFVPTWARKPPENPYTGREDAGEGDRRRPGRETITGAALDAGTAVIAGDFAAKAVSGAVRAGDIRRAMLPGARVAIVFPGTIARMIGAVLAARADSAGTNAVCHGKCCRG